MKTYSVSLKKIKTRLLCVPSLDEKLGGLNVGPTTMFKKQHICNREIGLRIGRINGDEICKADSRCIMVHSTF